MFSTLLAFKNLYFSVLILCSDSKKADRMLRKCISIMNGKKLFVDNILESHLYRDGLGLSCNDTIMLAGNFSLNFF